jgi:hypothetical protein
MRQAFLSCPVILNRQINDFFPLLGVKIGTFGECIINGSRRKSKDGRMANNNECDAIVRVDLASKCFQGGKEGKVACSKAPGIPTGVPLPSGRCSSVPAAWPANHSPE